MTKTIRPHPGPQTRFLSSSADIVVFGGGRGGGKTGGLVMDPARGIGFAGYRAMLLRRTYPEIIQPHGLWETSREWYPVLGGRSRESSPMQWRFPSGAAITLSHLQYEADLEKHLGAGLDYVGIDQAEGFTERQIWGMWSGLRSTTPGVKPAFRMTCNPHPDCYLRMFLDWWIGEDGYVIEERDGATRWMFRREKDGGLCWGDSMEELWPAFEIDRADLLELEPDARPLSVRFVVANPDDNPSLNPGYMANLYELPAVERERYLGDLKRRGGNWNVRPAAGNVFRLREWCRFVDFVEPGEQVVKVVRGWDFAGTKPTKANRDPDWTRCIKVARTKGGRLYLLDGDGLRETPGTVRDRFAGHAQADGPGVTQALWQDPAQSGKDQIASIMREVTGVPVRARSESQTKHTAMAGTIASQAEHGNVDIVRGPWNDSFLAETDAFPDGKHDDWVAALCRAYLEIGTALRTDGYRGTQSTRRESASEPSRVRRGARRAHRGLLV